MRWTLGAVVAAFVLGMTWTVEDASARGNLAARPVDLPTLVMDASLNFTVKEYKIETGLYYRWKIESKGGEEFQFFAPDLWRNSWVNQFKISGIEVKSAGTYSLEFDDPGVIEVTFIPIRPGRYRYWVGGQEQRGMQGVFVVD